MLDKAEKKGGSDGRQPLTLLLALSDHHEGETIKRLLDETGHTVQDLAKACHVEWPAAKKYMTAKRLGAKAWETCSRGLLKLEIDPSLVRPTLIETLPTATVEDLKPLLPQFKDDQLDTLRRILKADSRARDRLIDAIDGILLWRKK